MSKSSFIKAGVVDDKKMQKIVLEAKNCSK
jgi:hypothetical protein